MTIQLKDYQEEAVKELLEASEGILKKVETISALTKCYTLVFKAPTWSGKTVMMQQYLKDFADLDRIDCAFIWISVNNLALQSKASFEKNMSGSKLSFATLDDIQDKVLDKNQILFINWESINTTDKATGENKNIAMRDNETGKNLPNYLKNTHNEGRKIVLIVDESHIALNSKKSQGLIQEYFKPMMQIEVSATPDSTGYNQCIEVEIDKVIGAGMIKKEILINESIRNFAESEKGTTQVIVAAALAKQKELLKKYKAQKSGVKPLVLIQLPSSAQKTSDLDKGRLEEVQEILKEFDISVENKKLAIWLSDRKDNKDRIDEKDSPVEVLLFKQAIATGWDCPRAQILVMFREIKTITFEIQTVGRILRMPEQKHYKDEEALNKAYVFTDLVKESVSVGDSAKNIIKQDYVFRDEELYKDNSFLLKSFYQWRVDYQDLGSDFWRFFAQELLTKINGKWELSDRATWDKEEIRGYNKKQLECSLGKKLDFDKVSISDSLIVNGTLKNIDKIEQEIIAEEVIETRRGDGDLTFYMDNYARSNLYSPFTNVARSYSPLKEAIYASFDTFFFNNDSNDRVYYQKIVLTNQEFFSKVIEDAMSNYAKQREQDIKEKKAKNAESYDWSIPKTQAFSNLKTVKYNKNIMKNAQGYSYDNFDSDLEREFVKNFLEKEESIQFWFKNGESLREYFAVPYVDDDEVQKSFYPDFIVCFTDGRIGIFDTKDGVTLKNWKTRAKGLADYIENWNKNKRTLLWGLVKHNEKTWFFYVNNRPDYDVEESSHFTPIGEFIKNT